MALKHKHLIISAEVNYPPRDAEEVEAFLVFLIKRINMNLAKGLTKNPQAYYCEKNGNRGVTGMAILETSHCAIHVWDEEVPAKMELDVYSCAEFDLDDIVPLLQTFGPKRIQYKFLDREKELTIIEENTIINNVGNT